MCWNSQTGQHAPAGLPLCRPHPPPCPPTLRPLSAPDTLCRHCPRLRHHPTPSRFQVGPHKPKCPRPSAQPQKQPRIYLGTRLGSERGGDLPTSHRPNPRAPVNDSSLRTPPLPTPYIQWAPQLPSPPVGQAHAGGPFRPLPTGSAPRSAAQQADSEREAACQGHPARKHRDEAGPTPHTSCRAQPGATRAWWAARSEHPGAGGVRAKPRREDVGPVHRGRLACPPWLARPHVGTDPRPREAGLQAETRGEDSGRSVGEKIGSGRVR